MNFDIVTIFPEFFSGTLDYGIVRRARESGLIAVRVHDLREFTHDRHRTVDDRPFGGGEGMVLKPEPLFEAVEALGAARTAGGTEGGTAVVLLSASGKLFRQATAQRLAGCERVVLLCGRYEGVDERVAEHLATEELSIGDFVLSGGELGAALVIDAVTRLLPGALGNEASSVHESFAGTWLGTGVKTREGGGKISPHDIVEKVVEEAPAADGGERAAISARETASILLDWPHYTRPAEFRNWAVPEVLLSGNHQEIQRWRLRTALEKTRRNRPDLLAGVND
jgi:tRNA (guanine37-N1)-methyltransferase